MIPQLNWLEVSTLVDQIRPEIEGVFVDRVIVPERNAFSESYLKGEWLIRLTGRRQDSFLLISIFPRRSYLAWSPGKGPKASPAATRSPFDLNLSKNLKGSKLLKVEAIHKERVIILWFSQAQKGPETLGLVLSLIPAAPEAFLVEAPESAVEEPHTSSPQWKILARSRTIRDESKQIQFYTPPDGAKAPEQPTVRSEFFTGPEKFCKVLERELRSEAFDQRNRRATKHVRETIKQAQDRIRQSGVTLHEARHEEDWQTQGDLLKSVFSSPSYTDDQKFPYRAFDYTRNEEIIIPRDPKLTLQQQVEKYYQNARRKQKRISEAQGRLERFQESLQFLQAILDSLPQSTPIPLTDQDWLNLEKAEKKIGLQPTPTTPGTKPVKKASQWLGKTFESKDTLAIWVGRSKDENLELTFKHARGNDIWLHVRGRPGAHALIPIQPGKSAPLETLLDAAQLVIFYSGGENWGKTEVDYTFKKYVKRIKDSTEASYTNNKTLIIQPDPVRLKRLLGSE
jgi:hypothetical protein